MNRRAAGDAALEALEDLADELGLDDPAEVLEEIEAHVGRRSTAGRTDADRGPADVSVVRADTAAEDVGPEAEFVPAVSLAQRPNRRARREWGRRVRRALRPPALRGARRPFRSPRGGADAYRQRDSDFWLRVVWRAATGDALWGAPRTNSTWSHPATSVYVAADESVPGWWSIAPRLARMSVRWAGAATVGGLGYCLRQDPETTVAALEWVGSVGGGLALAGAGYGMTGRVIGWPFRRRYLRPAHLALAPRLGYPERTPPERYLDIPRDFHQSDSAEARLLLPAALTGEDRELDMISQILRTKLALGDVVTVPHLVGREHWLEVRHRERPPSSLNFAELWVRELVAAQPEAQPLVGLGTGGRIVAVHLNEEAPHLAVSAAPGAGKSTLLGALLAQRMRWGDLVAVVDPKAQSLSWLMGLPGVDYWTEPEEIHHGIIAVAAEADRRNRLSAEHKRGVWAGTADPDNPPRFPRLILVMEEANATKDLLQIWWHTHRASGDSARSPAMLAFGRVLYMGREPKVHVFLATQLATANALGGPALRECFSVLGGRIMAKASPQAWKMFAPSVNPPPPPSHHLGRVHVVFGPQAIETQFVRFTPQEARAWAQGAPMGVTGSQVHSPRTGQRQGAVNLRTYDGLLAGTPANQGPKLVSLRDAAQDTGTGLVDRTLEGLRQAKYRFDDFPQPTGKDGQTDLYDPNALADWSREHPKADRATREEVTP